MLDNSIVILIDNNNKQQAELRDLSYYNANLKKNVATPNAGGGRCQGNLLNAKFPGCVPKQYWVRVAYWWSNRFGIEKRHDSAKFCDKNTVHKDVDTRENTMGGMQANNNWDA